MAIPIRLYVPTAAVTLFSNGGNTGLNSLASGSQAISDVLDNTTALDPLVNLELDVAYTTTAPTAGQRVADLYMVPSLDGTNYGEGSSSIRPEAKHLIGSFESRNGSTSAVERLMLKEITLTPGKHKFVLVNQSGKTYHATLCVLKAYPYQYQGS